MSIIEDWLREVDVEWCQSSRSLARFATQFVTVTRVIRVTSLPLSHMTRHMICHASTQSR